MAFSPSFPIQLAQNVALIGGLVVLHGLILRAWHPRDPRAQIGGGLLFGLATLAGMHVPLPLLPGVFYDARSVVLTCAGAVLPAPAALLAGGITVAGRLALGGVGAWVGASVAVASVAAGMGLRRLRRGRIRWPRGWLAAALVSHGLLVLTQFGLPAEATRLFLSQVMGPLLLVFVPATVGLGILLDALEREHLNSAVVVAAVTGSPEPVAVRLRARWWVNRAFVEQIGALDGRPPPGVAETLLGLAPHASLADLTIEGPAGACHFSVRCLPALAENQRLLGRIFLLRDLSAERAAKAQARYMEQHDRLTGLPNRAALLAHLAGGAVTDGALVAVDLPELRAFNVRNGRRAGDGLLRELAQHLSVLCPPETFPARIVGSEFAVWCPGEAGLLRAETLARRLQEGFAVEAGGRRREIGLEVGLARFDGAIEPSALLARAEQTVRWARENPSVEVAPLPWYGPAIGHDVDRRQQIVQALPEALNRGGLRLVFQPVVRLADRRVVGCEALLRWRSPTLGDVSPADFVPLAEQAGLMAELGDWVVERGARAAEAHRARFGHPVLALNISAVQLNVPGFGAQLVRRLRGWGVRAEALELELTETAVLDDHRPEVRASLEALRHAGLGLVIDDFGTGYSSLLTLQRLDVRKLKIPREFVTQLPDSRADLAIVRATLQLGRALGLTVQAEGIETEAQASLLTELGCELAQGYLFDRPLEQADYEARLAEQAAGAPVTSRAGSPRT